jgi:hypothetical protein
MQFHSDSDDLFPYLVHISLDLDYSTFSALYDWLETHVGERDDSWCYPTSTIVRFKHESDAIQFSLTWS